MQDPLTSYFMRRFASFYQCMKHASDSLFLSLFISLSLILYLSFSLSFSFFSLSISLNLSLAPDLSDNIISIHKPLEIQDYTVSTLNHCDILILYLNNVWIFYRTEYTRNRVQKNCFHETYSTFFTKGI